MRTGPRSRRIGVLCLLLGILGGGSFSGGILVPGPLAHAQDTPSGGVFVRGNANADPAAEVDISDAIFILTYLFLGGEPPPCMDAGDVNDDGGVDITDPISLLNYLFLGGLEPPPPTPPGPPDVDPTEDALSCATDPDADTDGDGLLDRDEVALYGSDPLNVDTDGDGLTDREEALEHETDPAAKDTDGDGLDDSEELTEGADGFVTHPLDPDTDSDGLADGVEEDLGSSPIDPDTDSDGLTDAEENARGTDPTLTDTDADGLLDAEEVRPGEDETLTDPLSSDSDGDGLTDAQEVGFVDGSFTGVVTDPRNADTDGDGLLDGNECSWNVDLDEDGSVCAQDIDSDGDGLPDPQEDASRDGTLDDGETNPCDDDTDGDSLPDGWERANGLDPRTDDAEEDPDADGLSNEAEHSVGAHPGRPDTDGDGLPDGEEVAAGTNPDGRDTDGDGLLDGTEVDAGSDPLSDDSDGDGLPDGLEPAWNEDRDGDGLAGAIDADSDDDGIEDGVEDADQNGIVDPGETDPVAADTDGDEADDGWEVDNGFDPLDADDGPEDPDGDGASNALESRHGTDPRLADTDNDGLLDGAEIAAGTDPHADDAGLDLDGDGLTNLDEHTRGTAMNLVDSDADGLSDPAEIALGTDPRDPDTDDDGAADGTEVEQRTDPFDDDSDGDGLEDGEEISEGADGHITDPLADDTDGDGILDAEEVDAGDDGFVTDPTSTDTDEDGLEDFLEVSVHGSDPSLADTDGDGLLDAEEVGRHTDPNDPDTDGDGISDFDEYSLGMDLLRGDSDGDGVLDSEDPGVHDSDIDRDGLIDGEEAAAGCVWFEGELTFVRGDVNGDGLISIPDALVIAWEYILQNSYRWVCDGPGCRCLDAADANDDGVIDEGDMARVIDYVFGGGPPPAPPFPEAGWDPTADDLVACDVGGVADSQARNGLAARQVEDSDAILEAAFRVQPGSYRLIARVRTDPQLVPSPASGFRSEVYSDVAAFPGGVALIVTENGGVLRVEDDEVTDLTEPGYRFTYSAVAVQPGTESALLGSHSGKLVRLEPGGLFELVAEGLPPVTDLAWHPDGESALVTVGGAAGAIYQFVDADSSLSQVASGLPLLHGVTWWLDGSVAIVVGANRSAFQLELPSSLQPILVPDTVPAGVDFLDVAVGPDEDLFIAGEDLTFLRFVNDDQEWRDQSLERPDGVSSGSLPDFHGIASMSGETIVAGSHAGVYRVRRGGLVRLPSEHIDGSLELRGSAAWLEDPGDGGDPTPRMLVVGTDGAAYRFRPQGKSLAIEIEDEPMLDERSFVASDLRHLESPHAEGYRWYRTPFFEIRRAYRELPPPLSGTLPLPFGVVAISVKEAGWEDPACGILLDRLFLQAAQDPNAPPTDPADPDTDGDGIRDGEESAPVAFWYEAEDYAAEGAAIVDDGAASNARAVLPGGDGSLATVRVARRFSPPPGEYQVLLRAAAGPSATHLAQVRVRVFLGDDPVAAVDELVDVHVLDPRALAAGDELARNRYVWRGTTCQEPPAFRLVEPTAVRLELSAAGPGAETVALDKLAVAKLCYAPVEISTEGGFNASLGMPRHLTDPLDPDTDLDGYRFHPAVLSSPGVTGDGGLPSSRGSLTDGHEAALGMHPLLDDSDGDFRRDSLDFAPLGLDADKDGLPDVVEDRDSNGGFNPPADYTHLGANDSDGDGILDGNEDANFNGDYDRAQRETHAGNADLTGPDGAPDGMPDGWDTDLDGLPDGLELGLVAPQKPRSTGVTLPVPLPVFVPDSDPDSTTDPREIDTDSDGLPDGWIDGWSHNGVSWGVWGDRDGVRDPWEGEDRNLDGRAGAGETDAVSWDTDGDFLFDGEETVEGADGFVTDPLREDTDGDGLVDGAEVHEYGTNPTEVDTDSDGLTDAEELEPGEDERITDPTEPDTDGDGLTDGEELFFSDPTLQDTDRDALGDWAERELGTFPRMRDTDGDTLRDGQEDADHDGTVDTTETDPRLRDTDGDGFDDALELLDYRTDPRDPESYPRDQFTMPGTGILVTVEPGGSFENEGGLLSTTDRVSLLGSTDTEIVVTGGLAVDLAGNGGLEGSGTVALVVGGVDVPVFSGVPPGATLNSGFLEGLALTAIPVVRDVPIPGELTGGISIVGLADAQLDLREGELRGYGTVVISNAAGLEVRLEGDLYLKAQTGTLELDGELVLDLPGTLTDIVLSETELTLRLSDLYMAGSARLPLPTSLPGLNSTISLPRAEFEIDPQNLHFRFFVNVGLRLDVGPLTVGAGAGAKFEIDPSRGYFLIDACLGVPLKDSPPPQGAPAGAGGSEGAPGEIAFCFVLEISQDGEILFEPKHVIKDGESPVCGETDISELTGAEQLCRAGIEVAGGRVCSTLDLQDIRGHFRGGGSVGLPVAPPLSVSLDGKLFVRMEDPIVIAANGTVGIGASVVGVEMGGSTVVFVLEDEGDGPRLSCIVIGSSSGLAFRDFAGGLGDLGRLGGKAEHTLKIDVAEKRFYGRGRYTFSGFEVDLALEGGALSDDFEGVQVVGCMDPPFGQGPRIDVEGYLGVDETGDFTACIGGKGEFVVGGATLAEAEITLRDDGLQLRGDLELPGLGEIEVEGSVTRTSGSTVDYELTGTGTLAPFGLDLTDASVRATPGSIEVTGTLDLGAAGSAAVSGSYYSSGNFSLTGALTLSLGGFSVDGSVSISEDGASFEGRIRVEDSFVELAGEIESGSFLLEGVGSVWIGGFHASGVFELRGSAASAALTLFGSLALENVTLTEATISLSSAGGLEAEGTISWAGASIATDVSITPSGVVSASGSIGASGSAAGVTVSGSVQVESSTSGTISVKLEGTASGLGVSTSINVSVKSNGKVCVGLKGLEFCIKVL